MGSVQEKADWFQSWLEEIRDERAKQGINGKRLGVELYLTCRLP
jgi:putative component of toxin-antitoxin plasmid stabilization module